MMKSAFRCVQIVLLFYGVFGADEDEVKAVSVIEGDSVTLNPDLTQKQTINLIEWRFGDSDIAKTGENDIIYPSYTEIFRGRLQLDQTGSLTIKNMKTKHAGVYQLKISHSDGTTDRKFNVTVYESASDPGESEMKSVSVKEGDRVTLQTGVIPLSGDELIVWRFGDEGKVIAKADIEAKSSPLYYDERFRDRLELELDQTGSLIITDTRSTDSGFYAVKISSSTQTVYKRFSVSVSVIGLSPGGKAGIVVAVLLVLAAAAAAAVGFIYQRRKISELQTLRNVSVTAGESVRLSTDRPEIERGDVIQWRFGDENSLIAEIKEGTGKTHDGPDGRFRDRLQLDKITGDLTIKNSTDKHAGYYKLKISSRKGNRNWTYSVTIRVTVTVTRTKGEDVILKPNKTIQKGDGILWMFGEEETQTSIAKLIRETGEFVTHDYAADGIFRGRLVLDTTTGSLIITNSRPEHSGLYTLYIRSSGGDSQQRFIVTVSERVEEKSVEEGDTVTLNPDTEIQKDDRIQWIFEDQDDVIAAAGTETLQVKSVKDGDSAALSSNTEIQRDDQILWMFGDQDDVIAQIRGETGEICIYHDAADGRFRGRLKLEKTGSLTITNIKPEHTGLYKLLTITSRRILCKRFWVYMQLSRVYVTEGDSVHLSTGRPKIERGDVIQWRCGEEIIAEIKEETGKTHDDADERFRDRLQLDKITGDLTIKRCTAEDEGYYKLKIISSKGNTDKTYSVIITVRSVSVTEGESVHLSTDRPEIERDDEIQWRFGDENSLIAEIKGGTGKTHDGPDGRFRDRLQLDKITGDLTIKSSTAEHAGYYKLNIRSRKGNTNWTYRVTIRVRDVSMIAGNSVRLHTDRPKIERDDVIQWMFGDEIIAEIKGGTGKIHDRADERFRDRLQLDDQTGDLTIKNSTAEDTGDYKLKIISSKVTTNRTYSVGVAFAIKPRKELPVKGNNDESVVEMQPLMT